MLKCTFFVRFMLSMLFMKQNKSQKRIIFYIDLLKYIIFHLVSQIFSSFISQNRATNPAFSGVNVLCNIYPLFAFQTTLKIKSLIKSKKADIV